MLKLNLTLIFGLVCLILAAQQDFPFCGFDQEQAAIYHNDSLRQVRHERAVEISLRAREFRAYRTDPNRAGGGEVGVLNQDCFVIPVVVHVFHDGEPLNEGTNISYAQIHSAINRLNESFAGVNGGVDTKIRFCLVQETPFGIQWADPTEPGILRYDNPYSSEVTMSQSMVTEVIAANNPVLFESGTVVHIATVQNIDAIGNAGALTIEPDFLSGTQSWNPLVRIRPTAFGHTLDDNDPLMPFLLDPLFLQNATLAHEMGHVFLAGTHFP